MRALIAILTFILLSSCEDVPNFSDYEDISKNRSIWLRAKDSTAIIFDETGKTFMQGKLVNGKREGTWSEYVTDGNYKCYEYTFKDDLENGKCYSFTITGKIELVGNRKNGTLDGTFVYFDLKGKPEKIQVWKEIAKSKGVSELVYEKDLKQE